MKLLILILFIATASAAKFETSRCANGPEFWCKDRSTAANCGAVNYCEDNVWAKSLKTNDVCADCEKFVGDLQSMLENTTIQNELISDIKMLCADLGPYADQCNSLVDQYGSIVLNLLASEMDPSTICSTVQLCGTEKLLAKYLKQGDDMCSNCEAFFGDVQSILKNATIQQEIDNFIMSTCQKLGFTTADCSLVLAVAPEVFNFLASELDPKTVCTAIQFCKSALGVAVKGNNDCADCKAFFGDAAAILKNTTVQNELVQKLLPVCSYLATYQAECKVGIQSFLPTILTAAAGYLSTACPAIGFCPSEKPTLKLKSIDMAPANDECTDCTNFFGDVKTVLMNSTNQDTIVNALKSVCGLLGQYADQCNSYVDQYAKLAISLVASSLDAGTICKDIGFCASKTAFLKLTGDNCADCEAFFKDVQNDLNNSTDQKEIMDKLKSVCSLFGSEEDECQNLIDTYGPTVFSLLASELDPKSVCTLMQFCQGALQNNYALKSSDMCSTCKAVAGDVDAYLNNPTTQGAIITALEVVCSAAGSLAEECKLIVKDYAPLVIKELATLLEPNSFCSEFGFCSSKKVIPAIELIEATKINKLTGTAECEACEYLMKTLDSLLNENSTEDYIVKVVDNVCSVLPGQFSTECDAIVKEYGDVLIKLLVQQINPSKICSELKLCSTKLHVVNIEESVECVLCEYVMKELDSILSDNATEQEIINALEKVCSYLPTTIQDDCNNFVDAYGKEIIDLLKEMSPDAVCSALQLCTSTESLKETASGGCIICEFVMKEIDELLADNATEQEIINALDKVCSLLPSTISDDCTVFVNTYGETIIQLLVNEIDPVNVCKALTLCTDTVVLKVTDEETCDLCKMVVMYADEYLEENSTIEEVNKVLTTMCSIFQGDYKAKCQSLVLEYGDVIPKLIAQLLNPTKVCQEINVCLASKPLLGEKECTYGPSYWCASMENAKKCNVVAHCKNHVWN